MVPALSVIAEIHSTRLAVMRAGLILTATCPALRRACHLSSIVHSLPPSTTCPRGPPYRPTRTGPQAWTVMLDPRRCSSARCVLKHAIMLYRLLSVLRQHATQSIRVLEQSNYCLKIIQDAADGTVATGSCYRSLLVLSGIQCDANGKVGRAYLQVGLHSGISSTSSRISKQSKTDSLQITIICCHMHAFFAVIACMI